MRILGIETSCDETGVAIFDENDGIIGEAVYSQVKMHAEFGGVVPELASRDHIHRIIPLTEQVLDEAGMQGHELDGLAYTRGPGLMGALLVGASVARSLAYGWNIPAIGIHHMEGHCLAPMLEDPAPEFPFLALLVSGGHTLIVRVNGSSDYELLGESLDDAAGEAFDKTAKLLGLPYPGGPAISALAEQGNPERFQFPRPMTDRPGLDFSFSGLKTFALNTVQANSDDEQTRADIARAFVDAVVDTLLIKCKRALKQTGLTQLVVSGGVSANKQLRERFHAELDAGVFFPRPEYCTDNGAMIAYAGYCCFKSRSEGGILQGDGPGFQPKPRWPMNEIV